KKTREPAAFTAVDAVEAGVLRDEEKFLDAPRGKHPGFAHDGLFSAAAVVTSERGNDAERALVIAPFGDLQVGIMPGRREHSRRISVIDVGRQALGSRRVALGFKG